MGASSPSRLVERAAELGYSALALVDDNGVYGAVEAQRAGKQYGVKVLIGATVQLKGDTGVYPLSLIAMNRVGYEVLCNLLTTVHADDEKLVTATGAAGAHKRPHLCHRGQGRFSDPATG